MGAVPDSSTAGLEGLTGVGEEGRRVERREEGGRRREKRDGVLVRDIVIEVLLDKLHGCDWIQQIMLPVFKLFCTKLKKEKLFFVTAFKLIQKLA